MKYLWSAFANRWNLLLFGGGVAAALISGFPGVVLPLVAAAELYYLASMVANGRFRSAVDAQDAKARRLTEAAGAREAYERIRKQLPGPLLRRWMASDTLHCGHSREWPHCRHSIAAAYPRRFSRIIACSRRSSRCCKASRSVRLTMTSPPASAISSRMLTSRTSAMGRSSTRRASRTS